MECIGEEDVDLAFVLVEGVSRGKFVVDDEVEYSEGRFRVLW